MNMKLEEGYNALIGGRYLGVTGDTFGVDGNDSFRNRIPSTETTAFALVIAILFREPLYCIGLHRIALEADIPPWEL